MVSSILALPNDILLAIFLQLSAPDLLHLSQVCRVLHEYTLDSYLWHQVLSRQTDLPLNIDPYVDAAELSAPILQKATRDALRIDNNWKRHNPQIRQMTRIGDIENILQMQLLGSQYLVILRRHLPSLSVWRVIAKRAVLCARTDLEDSTTPLRFAASLDSRKEQILLALISTIKSGTQLSAYSVMLSDESDFSPASLKMVYNISRVDPDPFYEVHVYSHLIAIGIHSVLAPQLLIVNTVAKTRCLVHLHLPEGFSQLQFKLAQIVQEPCQIILTYLAQSTFVVKTYELPLFILESKKGPTESIEIDLGDAIEEYQSQAFPGIEYNLCADSTHRIACISGLSFHSLTTNTKDNFFRLSLGADGRPVETCQFQTHPSATAEIVCLGENGLRAIWLERRWTSDDYTLMKAVFFSSSNQVLLEPLFGKHLALPFMLHHTQALAFDELTGRVAIALHRDLYVVEF